MTESEGLWALRIQVPILFPVGGELVARGGDVGNSVGGTKIGGAERSVSSHTDLGQ